MRTISPNDDPAVIRWILKHLGLDANEITDKGYINQRATLERRAAEVERLYAEPPGENVIVVEES